MEEAVVSTESWILSNLPPSRDNQHRKPTTCSPPGKDSLLQDLSTCPWAREHVKRERLIIKHLMAATSREVVVSLCCPSTQTRVFSFNRNLTKKFKTRVSSSSGTSRCHMNGNPSHSRTPPPLPSSLWSDLTSSLLLSYSQSPRIVYVGTNDCQEVMMWPNLLEIVKPWRPPSTSPPVGSPPSSSPSGTPAQPPDINAKVPGTVYYMQPVNIASSTGFSPLLSCVMLITWYSSLIWDRGYHLFTSCVANLAVFRWSMWAREAMTSLWMCCGRTNKNVLCVLQNTWMETRCSAPTQNTAMSAVSPLIILIHTSIADVLNVLSDGLCLSSNANVVRVSLNGSSHLLHVCDNK